MPRVPVVRTGLSCLALTLAMLMPLAAAAEDPALSNAETMPRANRSLLLDVAPLPSGFVAVGERGHVLRSDDGVEWRQLTVPTRSTLTAVTVHDGQVWVVGHDGVVLHSPDGGDSWQRRRADPRAPDSYDPNQGLPLLDVTVLGNGEVLAIGAYAQLLASADSGESWESRAAFPHPEAVEEAAEEGAAEAGADWTFDDADLDLEDEADPHLNAIAQAGDGALVIAGERGAILRSRDGGHSWERLSLPYEGSMFGVLAWEGGHILVFGLRGNVLESQDLGDSWREIDTGITDSLMGGRALPGGGAILVGANGAVL
ncbi:MAG TPA: YCF48-related protein, partial [Arenimonas sp.]|nr:YCF48-related protein [Arenimonas sp.]